MTDSPNSIPLSGAFFARRLAAPLVALILLPASVVANEYSPPGFYEVEQIRLDNGMRVLLKQRGDAKAASLRLAVEVGTLDMPCEEAEIPHLLEHVVFEGTEAYPEAGDLDHFVAMRGGYSNASTYIDQTVYEIDIYGPETPAAVDALYQRVHKALLEDAAVEGEKAAVHRELGSDASPVRRWLYARGIGQSGWGKAKEVLGDECPGMERADHVTREQLVDFYREHYVPGNMTLVVVGRFDSDAVLQRIRETFSTMPIAPVPEDQARARPQLAGPVTVESTLAPVLGSEATVYMVFPTAGNLSEDYPALVVLGDYLEDVLYNRLRRDAGLSYGPNAGLVTYSDHGYIYVGADVAPTRLDEATDLIRAELDALVQDGIDAETLEETIRSLMLGYAQGSETNSDMADYYVNSLAELDTYGQFLNYEDRIEAVTPEHIHDVAARVFRPENSVTALDAPTFGYSSGVLLGGAVLVLGVVLTGRGIWRKG